MTPGGHVEQHARPTPVSNPQCFPQCFHRRATGAAEPGSLGVDSMEEHLHCLYVEFVQIHRSHFHVSCSTNESVSYLHHCNVIERTAEGSSVSYM